MPPHGRAVRGKPQRGGDRCAAPSGVRLPGRYDAPRRVGPGLDGFRVTAQPEGQPGVGSIFSRERTGESQGPLAIRPGPGPASSVTVTLITAITVYQPHDALTFETRASYNGLLYSVERTSFELQPSQEGAWVTKASEVEIMVPSAFIGPVYAIRMVRAAFARLVGRTSPGPHLSRVKEMMETGKITRRI